MFSQIMRILEESLNFAISIFIDFVSGSFFGLFISFFLVLLITRLILVPLVGRAMSSDTVRPQKLSDLKPRQRGRGLSYAQERELRRRYK